MTNTGRHHLSANWAYRYVEAAVYKVNLTGGAHPNRGVTPEQEAAIDKGYNLIGDPLETIIP